jgi:hypothetical protein
MRIFGAGALAPRRLKAIVVGSLASILDGRVPRLPKKLLRFGGCGVAESGAGLGLSWAPGEAVFAGTQAFAPGVVVGEAQVRTALT